MSDSVLLFLIPIVFSFRATISCACRSSHGRCPQDGFYIAQIASEITMTIPHARPTTSLVFTTSYICLCLCASSNTSYIHSYTHITTETRTGSIGQYRPLDHHESNLTAFPCTINTDGQDASLTAVFLVPTRSLACFHH